MGILLWYSFHAQPRSLAGIGSDLFPEFIDTSDLTHPLRLSGAALTITWGPLLLLGMLFHGECRDGNGFRIDY